MNFIPWLLAISLLMGILYKTVAYHKATVCRQRAWLISTEMITRSLIKSSSPTYNFDLKCSSKFTLKGLTASWMQIPSFKENTVHLDLKGKL
jgi:hypothetical protein